MTSEPGNPTSNNDSSSSEEVLDLTQEEVSENTKVDHPQVRRYDPSKDRESMRGRMAVALLVLLAITVVGAFLSFWFNWATQDQVEGLLTIVFAPIVGLVGAATGFYFGSQASGHTEQGSE